VHRVIDAAFGGRILVREVDVSDNQMGGSIFEKVFDVRAKHHHTARTQKANPNQSYKEKKNRANARERRNISDLASGNMLERTTTTLPILTE